jgi:hypothetical protein
MEAQRLDFTRRRDLIASRLLGLVSQGLEPDSDSSSPALNITTLSRATTIFTCNADGCKQLILTYPAVISHRCFVKQRSRPVSGEPCGRLECKECTQGLNSGRNRTDDFVISFHEKASTWAKTIIILMGKNPKLVTCADMDASGLLLECVDCSEAGIGGMDWRSAVCAVWAFAR